MSRRIDRRALRRLSAVLRSTAAASLAAALLLAAAACDGEAGADDSTPDARPHDLVVFVYDRSASITDFQLERARELTDQRLRGLGFGDRIAALEVLQRSLSEPPRRWTQKVPDRQFEDAALRRDSVSKARFVRDAQDYLRRYTEAGDRGHIRNTDVLATLHDVASEVQAFDDHRAIVYLFSDMLQADGPIIMEGGRNMPPANWVASHEREGRLPDLGGACVMVIGARTDTQLGQQVKEFWMEYFEATGARLASRNYTYRPVRLPVYPCGRSAAPIEQGASAERDADS